MTFLEWMKVQAVAAWARGGTVRQSHLDALTREGVDVIQLERDARKEQSDG